jgi:hypothetical protein
MTSIARRDRVVLSAGFCPAVRDTRALACDKGSVHATHRRAKNVHRGKTKAAQGYREFVSPLSQKRRHHA